MKQIRQSLITGLSFGLTSGVITTIGLMVGLTFGTNSKMVVIGGILTIAVADALSDGLGMHISQESNHTAVREIWESTLATVFSKFIIALTFAVPVLLFPLVNALYLSIAWGLFLVSFLSYRISKSKNEPAINVILEHFVITVIVVIATYFIGKFIDQIFK